VEVWRCYCKACLRFLAPSEEEVDKLLWVCDQEFRRNGILLLRDGAGDISSHKFPRRKFHYGYRLNEVSLPDIPPPGDSVVAATLPSHANYNSLRRPPATTTLFPNLGATCPRPDTSNPDSLILGIEKRMAYKPPPFSKYKRKRFRRFVKDWVEKNLNPLDADEQFNFEQWIESTNYPEWRKAELRVCRKELEDKFVDVYNMDLKSGSKYTEVKIFTKDESYTEYKHFRGIWARSDYYKTVFGPICKKIEKKVFAMDYFIKKIPVNERASYIMEKVYKPGYKYVSTDFSQFESHFDKVMMKDCEFQLYRHMLSTNKNFDKIWPVISNVLSGKNFCVNKYFQLTCEAKRMSGEMSTSLGNGFSNLMFILFAAEEYDIDMTMPVVEGDDGLFGIKGILPESHFLELGLTVKLENHENINTASFCGLIFDPDERVVIAEPLGILADSPWVGSRYRYASKQVIHGLMKSKALSICWQYPGCPIVYKYGLKMLGLLENFKFVTPKYNYWHSGLHDAAMEHYQKFGFPLREPGQGTRTLMEAKFGISILEQLRIEQEIDMMTLDDELISTTAFLLAPQVWKDDYTKYVRAYEHQSMREIECFETAEIKKQFSSSKLKFVELSTLRSKNQTIKPHYFI